MQVIPTGLPSVYILEPKVFGDSRGWFMETWSERDLERAGLHYRFVQDNQSFSAQKGVLRGIHFQKGDAAQAKIVRCNRGAVLDVAVDLRKGSPTFKKWVSVELSADNKRQLLIPRGFGHAFLTLTGFIRPRRTGASAGTTRKSGLNGAVKIQSCPRRTGTLPS